MSKISKFADDAKVARRAYTLQEDLTLIKVYSLITLIKFIL